MPRQVTNNCWPIFTLSFDWWLLSGKMCIVETYRNVPAEKINKRPTYLSSEFFSLSFIKTYRAKKVIILAIGLVNVNAKRCLTTASLPFRYPPLSALVKIVPRPTEAGILCTRIARKIRAPKELEFPF